MYAILLCYQGEGGAPRGWNVVPKIALELLPWWTTLVWKFCPHSDGFSSFVNRLDCCWTSLFTAISVAETGASRPQSYGKIDYFNVYDLNQTKTVSQKNTEITTKPEQFLQKSIRQIFNEHLSVFFFPFPVSGSNVRRETTRFEIDRKRDIWVHVSTFLGQNAVCWGE